MIKSIEKFNLTEPGILFIKYATNTDIHVIQEYHKQMLNFLDGIKVKNIKVVSAYDDDEILDYFTEARMNELGWVRKT
jgi:predicted adenine nucleotide alpha hydrolase (AANH) superfamily ATPase